MKQHILLSAVAAAALVACGGGGDSASNSTPAGPASTSTTISGTAAMGASIPNATVEVKCAKGSGTATTGADGRFSITLTDATRPCVLSVEAPDGTTLHSVVEAGSGTQAVANITPLTELVAASIAGGDTAEFFANFDATAQAKLTTDALTDAKQSITLALSGIVDLTGIDPLKDPLVAATGNTQGNGLDQKLDALGAALQAAQTSLADLSTAVASNTGTTTPVQTILQPASASCAGLRSGTYRQLTILGNHTELVNVDAANLTATYPSDGAVENLTADGACRFSMADAAQTLYVSKSGVTVVRHSASTDATASAVDLLIPEQTYPVSELAGTWNFAGAEWSGPHLPLVANGGTLTIDAAGHITQGADCVGISACQDWPADQLSTVTPNAEGGFNFGTEGERAFAFKAANGDIIMVVLGADGFAVATRQTPSVMPQVGAVRKQWDMTLNDSGKTSIPGDGEFTVQAVNTADKSYTRVRPNGNVETMRLDQPRTGMAYRASGSTVNSSGVPQPGGGVVALGGANVGISAVVNLQTNPGFIFSFSVNKP